MALIRKHEFSTIWLLLHDAIVDGSFVEFLKSEIPVNYEVGIWFEIDRRICDDAAVGWYDRPVWEWDHHVPVGYAIGYTPEKHRSLVIIKAARMHARSPALKKVNQISVPMFRLLGQAPTYYQDNKFRCPFPQVQHIAYQYAMLLHYAHHLYRLFASCQCRYAVDVKASGP